MKWINHWAQALLAAALLALPITAMAQNTATPPDDDAAEPGYDCSDIDIASKGSGDDGCIIAAKVLGTSIQRVKNQLGDIGTTNGMKKYNKRVTEAARRFVWANFAHRKTHDEVFGNKANDTDAMDAAALSEMLLGSAQMIDVGRSYSPTTAPKAKAAAPAPVAAAAPAPAAQQTAALMPRACDPPGATPAPLAMPAPDPAPRTGGTVP